MADRVQKLKKIANVSVEAMPNESVIQSGHYLLYIRMWYKRFLWLPLLIIVVFGAIVFGDGVYFNLARQPSSLQTASHDLSASQTKTAHAPTTPHPAATTQAASTTHAAVVPPAPTHRDYTSATTSMSQYTDTDFGFSFWYPSSWTVTKTTPTSKDDQGWFKDGSVMSVLEVHGTRWSNGVTIEEFYSPSLAITELGETMSASPVGVDQTYYFDTHAHAWMYKNLTDETNRPSGTISPADISHNTMGGLHIFEGAARYATNVIVPLSASNFLDISLNGDIGFADERYLADTITATDPSVATPTSTEVQLQTIQAEKDAYGALDDTPLPPQPTISAISPTTANPGELVTVYGTNFDSGTSVQLNSVAGMTMSTKVISSTTLTFRVPTPTILDQISEGRSQQFPFRVVVQNNHDGYTWPGITLTIPGY